MNTRYFPIQLLLLLLLSTLTACTPTSSPPEVAPAPTRVTVAPEFETFYEELGGEELLGQPISWVFHDSDNAPLGQYFPTVKLEMREGSPVVSPLGEWAVVGAEKAVRVEDTESGNSRDFPETGQTVSGDFLTFYEENQGERLLGLPITSVLEEDGQMVQYFVNGRLEKRPELPDGQQVVLTSLGKAYFETAEIQYVYRTTLLARPVASASVTNVDISSYVEAPILYGGDDQVLHVTVLTDDKRPIPELRVTAAMSYGETAVGLTELGVTDEQGNIETTLDVSSIPPEQDVKIIISVFSPTGKVIGTETLFFKTWW